MLDGDTTVSSAGGGHEAGGEAALITGGASGMAQSEAMIRVKQDLDRQLGKGSFDALTRLTSEGRYAEAEALLKSKRP